MVRVQLWLGHATVLNSLRRHEVLWKQSRCRPFQQPRCTPSIIKHSHLFSSLIYMGRVLEKDSLILLAHVDSSDMQIVALMLQPLGSK